MAALVQPVSSGITLFKTQLFANEKIVSEFEQRPECNNWCSPGLTRRIQITTHRICYMETYRKSCLSKTPPLMRQVFIKDISEISLDHYSLKTKSVFERAITFLVFGLFPLGGMIMLIAGSISSSTYSGYYDYSNSYNDDDYDNNDNSNSDGGSSALIACGIILQVIVAIYWIYYMFYKKLIPEVVFSTNCPQTAPFSILLQEETDRLKLIDDVSALISKNN